MRFPLNAYSLLPLNPIGDLRRAPGLSAIYEALLLPSLLARGQSPSSLAPSHSAKRVLPSYLALYRPSQGLGSWLLVSIHSSKCRVDSPVSGSAATRPMDCLVVTLSPVFT